MKKPATLKRAGFKPSGRMGLVISTFTMKTCIQTFIFLFLSNAKTNRGFQDTENDDADNG